MGKPYYFQTEDEKRMAASRLNASGRPVQMVRPMLPSSYDAREKWRENAGGKMIGMDQYLENNRKMYTLENVPDAVPRKQMSNKEILAKYGGTQAIQAGDNRPSGVYENGKRVESDNRSPGVYENGKRISPYRPPAAPTAPTSNWQQDITKKFPDIGKEGTAANKAYVDIYKEKMSSKQPFDPMELAKDVAGKFSSDISASAPMLTVQMPTESKPTAPTLTAPTSNMPTPQWQKDVTKIYPKIGERGTPENEAYVAEYKDRMSSKQPFDTMELADDVMGRFVPNTGLNTSGSAPAPIGQSGMSSGKNAWQRNELKPALARLSAPPNAKYSGPNNELSRPMGGGALDMSLEKRLASANDSARQSYDYYARQDARKFRRGNQDRSDRSSRSGMAF